MLSSSFWLVYSKLKSSLLFQPVQNYFSDLPDLSIMPFIHEESLAQNQIYTHLLPSSGGGGGGGGGEVNI